MDIYLSTEEKYIKAVDKLWYGNNRKALRLLKKTDRTRYDTVVAALGSRAEDDSYLVPFVAERTEPVVVDASNVAWFDQESLVNGRARLRRPRREPPSPSTMPV